MVNVRRLVIYTLFMAITFMCGAQIAIAATDEYNIMPSDFSGVVLSPEASIDDENGTPVLTTYADSTKWTFSTYSFAVDPAVMKKLTFTFMHKGEDIVKGENDWNAARLYVNFFDEDNQHINDWPSPGYWKGTYDWKAGKWSLVIPSKAVKAVISIGLDTCSGTFYMKDIVINAVDAQKNLVKPLAPLE